MSSSSATDAPQDGDEIDLLRIAQTIYGGRWVVATCILIAFLAAAFYAYRIAVPQYPAVATVSLIGQQQQVITDIDAVFANGGTDPRMINTEFEVIRSRRLIGDLVDQLNLTADPEFNGALAAPSMRQRIRAVLFGAPDVQAPAPEVVRSRVIDVVVARVGLSSIRNSLAFNIRIETTDPNKSTLIVNTLAELYIENQIRQKLEGTAQAIEFLSTRTIELQANAERLEQDLAIRTEQADVLTADLLQARNLQLRELRETITELQVRIASTERQTAELSPDLTIDALLVTLAESDDGRLDALRQRFIANRLSEEELREGVADTREEIIQSTRRLTQQLTSLVASEQNLAQQIRTQTDDLIALQQLSREVESAQLLYETFFNRLQEASVQQGLETADARILSHAVPRGASSPRKTRIAMIASVLGLLLGCGIVLVREWLFSGFRTVDDLRRETGQGVLGSIPSLGDNDRRKALAHMQANPNSVFAEAVRNLRTSILMSNIDKEPSVILITSSIPGEGKTTLSIALTRYLASMEGKRALLVEADIRRKTLRSYVDAEPTTSMLDLLLGKHQGGEIDLYNEELGIEVLSGSESGGGNAADLFSSRRFQDLIGDLKQTFDYIVMDTPPVLAVPDARVLAPHADAVVFAVKWSSTTKTQVRQGIDMLTSVGVDVEGLVMTQVDQRRMKGYGYGGQYGYDGYSSGYYSRD